MVPYGLLRTSVEKYSSPAEVMALATQWSGRGETMVRMQSGVTGVVKDDITASQPHDTFDLNSRWIRRPQQRLD